MGKYLETQRINKKNLKLILYQKVSRWWHRLCLKILTLSVIEITILFLFAVMGKMIMEHQVLRGRWYMAYILYEYKFI